MLALFFHERLLTLICRACVSGTFITTSVVLISPQSTTPVVIPELDYVVSKLSESDFIRYVKALQKGLKDLEKEGLELGYLKKEGGKICPS